MFIGNLDQLPPGTPVYLKNGTRRGVVVSCRRTQGIPYGLIAVHTVTETHKPHPETRKAKRGAWIPVKPRTYEINYTGIQVI